MTKNATQIANDINLRILEIQPQLDALVKEQAALQQLAFILNPPPAKRKPGRPRKLK